MCFTDGLGLVGHAGAVLLRKAADQTGLAGQVSGGAAQEGHVTSAGPPGPGAGRRAERATVRRALDLAGTPAALDRIARARAKARAPPRLPRWPGAGGRRPG